MSYAIIETGGKQYSVTEGDEIDVELLCEPKETVQFNRVLLVSDGVSPQIGTPYLPNAQVHAQVLGEVKGPKVVAFKYKTCKNYRRTVGHRQRYTRVKITKIEAA